MRYVQGASDAEAKLRGPCGGVSPTVAPQPAGVRGDAIRAAGRTLRHAVSAPRTYPDAADISSLLDELVARGVDGSTPLSATDVINDRNGGGKSAVHMAAQLHPDAEVTRLLLRLGGDCDAVTLRGHTPLIYAAGRGRWDAAKLLLAAGANAAVRCASGDTASLLAEKNPRLAPPGKAQELRAIEAEHALLRGGWTDYTKDELAMVHQAEHAKTCPNCRPRLNLPEDVEAVRRAHQLADEIEELILAQQRGTRYETATYSQAETGASRAAAAQASTKLGEMSLRDGADDGALMRVVELLQDAAASELAAGGHGSKGGGKSVFGAPCALRVGLLQLFGRFGGGDARARIRPDGTDGSDGDSSDSREHGHGDPAAPLLLLLRAARMDVLCPPGFTPGPRACTKAHAKYVIDAVARAARAPREQSKRALEAAGIAAVVKHGDTSMAADILRAWPSAAAVQCTTPGAPDDVALLNLASRMLTPLALQGRAQREELARDTGRAATRAACTLPTAYTVPGQSAQPSVSGLAQAIAWASAVRPRFWKGMCSQAAALAVCRHKGRTLLASLPKAVAADVRQVLEDAVAAGGVGAAPMATLAACSATRACKKAAQMSLEAAQARESHAAELAALPRAPPVPGAARHWVCDDADAERMVRVLVDRADAAAREGKTLLLGVDCEWHEEPVEPASDFAKGKTHGEASGEAETTGADSERLQGAPALVQIASSRDGGGNHGSGSEPRDGGCRCDVWLVDALHGSAMCSGAILRVLSHRAVTIVGFAFDSDVQRLRLLAGGRTFSPHAAIIDVQTCAQRAGVHAPGLGTPGLQRVCARCVDGPVCMRPVCLTRRRGRPLVSKRELTPALSTRSALGPQPARRLHVQGPAVQRLGEEAPDGGTAGLRRARRSRDAPAGAWPTRARAPAQRPRPVVGGRPRGPSQ